MTLAALLGLCGCQRQPPVPEGVVRLRMAVMGDKQESDLARALGAAFEKDHPGIRIAVEPVAGMGYDMKLTMQSAAGTLPDVVFLADSLVPSFIHYKIVKDLTPFIENDPSFNVGDIYPQMLETGKDRNGRVFMLPRELGVVVLLYNRTMFQRAGVPEPSEDWTYEEFVDAAQRLTVRDKKGRIVQYGYHATYNWPGLYGPMIAASGGRLLSPDRTESTLSAPASLRGLRDLTDLVTEYKVAMPPNANITAPGMDPFVAGKIAMRPIVFPAVPNLRATIKRFDWDVAMMPPGREKRVVTVGAAGYGMSAGTEHPEEAWEFLKFILSPEGQRVMARAGSGIPALKSLADDPSWRGSGLPPQNLDAFIDSVKYGMPWQETLTFSRPEVADVVNEAFERVFIGQATAEEAFREADRKITKVLARDKERQ